MFLSENDQFCFVRLGQVLLKDDFLVLPSSEYSQSRELRIDNVNEILLPTQLPNEWSTKDFTKNLWCSTTTARKQEKQKETGTKVFLQLGSGFHPGFCSVLSESIRICQNLSRICKDLSRICQHPVVSTRKFQQRAPQTPPLALHLIQPNSRTSPSVPWHCPVLQQIQKCAQALDFRLNLSGRDFLLYYFNTTHAGSFWNRVSLV